MKKRLGSSKWPSLDVEDKDLQNQMIERFIIRRWQGSKLEDYTLRIKRLCFKELEDGEVQNQKIMPYRIRKYRNSE